MPLIASTGASARDAIKIGDYFQMGTYYDALIIWRCVDIDKITVGIGNSDISYTTNNQSGTYVCDVLPQIVSGRTLVPVRAISESAGCAVDWNGDSQTVIITNE